jgi:hypothetical protein
MEQDEVARRARAAGLARYLEANPEQLGAALRAAADLAQRLPKDFTPAEECAHVMRLPPVEGRT